MTTDRTTYYAAWQASNHISLFRLVAGDILLLTGCSTDQSLIVSATLVVLERRKEEAGPEPSLYPTFISTP